MKKRGLVVIPLLLAPFAFLLIPAPAVAASFSCGDVITSSATLSADIGPCSGDGLTIGASNVALNCAGHTISGTETIFTWGINVAGSSVFGGLQGVTLMNCIITGFYFDLGVDFTSNSVIRNNVLENPQGYAAIFGQDQYDTFIGNSATNAASGMAITDTSNSVFIRNSVTGAYYNGIWPIDGSQGNVFIKNVADNNGVFGFYDTSSGAGTGGTANIYISNVCMNNFNGGSSPTGLCGPQS